MRRERGSTLLIVMLLLAVVVVLVGISATRFATIAMDRPRQDLRQQLLWAARSAATTGKAGRATVEGRVITVEVAGGRATARSGRSVATVTREGGRWTETFNFE